MNIKNNQRLYHRRKKTTRGWHSVYLSELLDVEDVISFENKQPHPSSPLSTQHISTTSTTRYVQTKPIQIHRPNGWDSFDLDDLLEDDALMEEEIGHH